MLNWLPENVSTYGGDIDHLLYYIYYLVGAWFILAEVVLFVLIFKSRKKEGQRAAYVPGRTWKSLAWVLVPAVLILICDLSIDFTGAAVWKRIKETTPPADVLVRITGKQFAWDFRYAGPDAELDTDDDITTQGEMVVPINKNIVFQLESQDVIHSLWLPHLRLKQDAVPGRSIPGWFNVTKVGTYPLVCAELCGLGHTQMKATLEAKTQADFDAWLDSQEAHDDFWDE